MLCSKSLEFSISPSFYSFNRLLWTFQFCFVYFARQLLLVMFSIERLRGKLVRGRPETLDRCVGISKLALQKYLQPSRLSRNSYSSQKLACTIHFRIVVLFQPRNSWHDDHRTAQFLTRCTSIYSNRYFYWRCILLGGRQAARSVPFTFSRIGSLQVWSICTNNSDP